jgi:hypothetical protein
MENNSPWLIKALRHEELVANHRARFCEPPQKITWLTVSPSFWETIVPCSRQKMHSPKNFKNLIDARGRLVDRIGT